MAQRIKALLLICLIVNCSDLVSAAAATRALDEHGGVLSINGKKTGWFHVEEIGGRWFFVTPEGHAFFSLGATHAIDCIKKDELNLFETKYQKSEVMLGKFLLEQLTSWGYNSAGYGALHSMESQIPYPATIWTEGPRSFSAGAKSKFTDIFDPLVQQRLRGRVRDSAARHINNPNCLGYQLIDLPVWHNEGPGSAKDQSYVDFIRQLPPQSAGHQAYVKYLRERYHSDNRSLEEAYGILAESFDALPTATFPSGAKRNAAMVADDELFLNRIADTYYAIVTGELRKIDPNHLVLGDRLMAESSRTYDSILQTAAKYVDVLSFQPMGTHRPLKEYWDKVHALTGKPVLLADVNCVLQRPAKDQADTSEYEHAAGKHLEQYYRDAASSLSCIGIHRCTVRDYQVWNKTAHRPGLLKADDTTYPILSQYTRRTNDKVYEMVYGSSTQEVDD